MHHMLVLSLILAEACFTSKQTMPLWQVFAVVETESLTMYALPRGCHMTVTGT